MKQLTLLLLLIIAQTAHGQSLSVFDVDASNFPTIRAKFYAFDAAGNQIKNLSETDFKVTENGTERTKKTVTCPNSIPVAVSSVLVFDMSGSMSEGPPRIESARKAANAWVDGLPLGKSECALVSFDDGCILLHDFTKDRAKLKNSIALLTPNGGTNYDQALINEPNGGLNIARTGKNKRVLIFLTDGLPNFEPRTQDIIAMAKQYNITIYTVTLDMPAPQCIKDMTKETGGQYFENITTLKEAEETYQKLLQLATSVDPCEITWESETSCNSLLTSVELKLVPQNIIANANYQSPNTAVAKLEFNPRFFRFQNPQLNLKTEQKITVTARNADYIVRDITTELPVGFDISPKSFSLKAGESIELTVSYIPTDRSYNCCRFYIESEPCAVEYYVSGGQKGIKPNTPTLKLTHPNGGDSFVVGSDTVITWEGVSPDDLVKLEYSIDNGATWKNIDTARGLSYKWNNIKRPESNNCLAQVKHIDNSVKPIWTTLGVGKDVKWSSDGSMIATCGGKSITLLDANTLDTINTINIENGEIHSVSISPDGTMIAAGNEVGILRIWDINSGNEIKNIIESYYGKILSVSISPDGTMIAAGIGNTINNIKIWDIASGNEILSLNGGVYGVNCISFSPDSKMIVSNATAWGEIKIWDVTSGNEITKFPNNQNSNFVSFSPDGKMIVTGGVSGRINILDATTGNSIRTITDSGPDVNCVCFSPDGTMIVSGSNDESIRFWDVVSGLEIKSLTSRSTTINSLSFSPDGKMIVAGSFDGNIEIWDIASNLEVKSLSGSSDWTPSITISSDGSMIANASGKHIKIWDFATGKNIKTLTGHTESVYDVCFSPDDSKIASVAINGCIKIWDAASGREISSIVSGPYLQCVSFSPDGTMIAIGGAGFKAIIILDVGSLKTVKTLYGHTESVYDVCFSPDGSKIASVAYNGCIKIWDAASGNEIYTIDGSEHSLDCVSFSPDSKMLITSGFYNDNIKIWDIASSKPIVNISHRCNSVCFSPDATMIASGGQEGIKIWDAKTGNEIKSFACDFIESVCFSPDGTMLASGGFNGLVKLWSLEGETLQSDVSDSLFAIVAPELNPKEIDMKQCLVGEVKDSLVTDFIINSGTYKCRVDSIYFTGTDKDAFSLVSGIPVYTIEARKNKATEFRFKPNRIGLHNAEIVIITQADTLRQTIKGEGVQPMLKVMNNLIDFGKVRVGTPRDSIQAVTIKNIGSAPLTITGTNHAAPDAVSFSTVSGGGNFTIPAGETHKMDLRFIPSSTYRTNGILQFHYNGAGSPAEILLNGHGVLPEIEVVNSELDFGRILLGRDTTLRQAVTIANTGEVELKITDVKITNPAFTRISGSTTSLLSPGASLKFDFTFTPTKLDMDYADLEIYHEEPGSPTIVKMKGEAYTLASNASAILEAGNISAYSGEIIELPIILKNQEHLSEANISKIKVDLFFNPTLLYPLDYPLQAINNQIAKITLDNLPANKAAGEALAKVKFKAALGNAEGCELTLDNAEPIGGTAKINLLPGSFSLLGICHEGGTRLVNPNANIGIQKIAPIPGKDKFTVTAKVTEADTKIRLIALNGKVITEIDCPMNKDKAQDFIIDLSEVAAGIYFIEFKSATFSQMEKVMVGE